MPPRGPQLAFHGARPERAGSPTIGITHLAVLIANPRQEVRDRLKRLDAELGQPDPGDDPSRLTRARAERDWLIAQLAGAAGLGGRPRSFTGQGERARVAVGRPSAGPSSGSPRRTPSSGGICARRSTPGCAAPTGPAELVRAPGVAGWRGTGWHGLDRPRHEGQYLARAGAMAPPVLQGHPDRRPGRRLSLGTRTPAARC